MSPCIFTTGAHLYKSLIKIVKSAILKILVTTAVFLLFFVIRFHSFYLTHENIDEMTYMSLAAKLDEFGIKAFQGEYNLRGINWQIENGLCKVIRVDLGSPGIPGLSNAKLIHQPPLLSYLLMFSHRVFTPKKQYASFCGSERIDQLGLQFYACLVPFLSSLLLVMSVYILGTMLFSKSAGLLASLLMILSPTDILTSQKIWADDLISFFLASAIILYLLALKKDNCLIALIAGIFAALSFLSKQSGILALPLVLAAHFIYQKTNRKSYPEVLIDKKIILFISFFCFVAIPWIAVFILNYGLSNFIFQYSTLFSHLGSFPTAFTQLVNSRPWYTYILTIPYQQPMFLLAYASIFYIFEDKLKRKNLFFLFLWFALFLGLATFMRDKEERYMLPAYPAISILSAYVFLRLSHVFSKDNCLASKLARAMLIFLVSLSFIEAMNIGLTYVFSRACLIPVPL